jgi:hypothetical protein
MLVGKGAFFHNRLVSFYRQVIGWQQLYGGTPWAIQLYKPIAVLHNGRRRFDPESKEGIKKK